MMCRTIHPTVCSLLLAAATSVFMVPPGNAVKADEPSPLELFETRIEPIFKSPEPSSCVQCHLSSVDLKDYILPSSRQTFLALRDQGLIDVDNPDRSKILHLISMGDQDDDRLARRLNQKTREAEYEAFSAWIHACVADKDLVSAPAVEELNSGPARTDEIIRHNRKDRVLDSFVRNVWSQRMRCFPCHTPADIDPNNPMHTKPAERHRDFVKKYGQRMNIFRDSPEATLRALIASSRKRHGDDLPLINVEEPVQSLLLQKPTARVPAKGEDGKLGPPSSAAPVSHMGGIKMHKDDHSYKAFVAWLEDYRQAVTDGYEANEQLPKDNWFPTNLTMRIKGTPETWPVLSTVQLFVYAWDSRADTWSSEPVAFSQTKIAPRKIAFGTMFLLANTEQKTKWSRDAQLLASGKYRIDAFVDVEKRIEADPLLMLNLGGDAPTGSAVIEAQWKEGFKNAQNIPGEAFQPES